MIGAALMAGAAARSASPPITIARAKACLDLAESQQTNAQVATKEKRTKSKATTS